MSGTSSRKSLPIAGPLVAGSLLIGGCGLFGGGGEVSEHSGDRVTVNGVTSDPLDEPVLAATVETPAGTFLVETYESELGGCYRLLVEGDEQGVLGQSVECLSGSGIHPDRPVTGTPDGSIEAINGGATNLALDDPTAEVGLFHHGLAHPAVSTVTIEPDGGQGPALGGFPVVDAPNVPGLRVFLAWSPPDLEAYRLNAYDDEGCLLDSDHIRVRGGLGDEPPPGGRPTCATRVPTRIRDVDVTVR